MDKKEVRVVIKLFYLVGKTATEIKSKLDAVLEDSSPSFSTVGFWNSSVASDEPRSGHPKTAITLEIVEGIHDMVLEGGRIKVREIQEAVRISYKRVVRILHNNLG